MIIRPKQIILIQFIMLPVTAYLLSVFVFAPAELSVDKPQFYLEAKELTESSGVCTTHQGDVIWSHNDSGDKARLFAFDRHGKLLSEVSISDAKAADWEDMCSFERGGEEFLAVADVGDNLSRRKEVQIYVLKVPALAKLRDDKKISRKYHGRLSVTYEDRAHNCEGIAYDSISQTFLLPTKENINCRFYEVDASDIKGKEDCVASFKQSIVLPMVTGADISADGKQLVLATYGIGVLLQRNDAEPKTSPRWIPEAEYEEAMMPLPLRKQGESVCFSADGKLLLTSEFAPTPLYEIEVQTGTKPADGH
ncbi:MAG: hypothetical protein AAF483_23940 [Planctomycetota bacterium]